MSLLCSSRCECGWGTPMRRARARIAAVEAVYERLAPFYDLIYGVLLDHGRRSAIERLAPKAGEAILEVGVGTALSALRYPPSSRVTAIDLSAPMLERARARLERRGCRHVG